MCFSLKVYNFAEANVSFHCRDGGMVDTRDLKSLGQEWLCGFESRSRHHHFILSRMYRYFYTFLLFVSALVLLGCSGRSGYLRIEGRFLNMNQGEFYVYSTEDATDGIDTIRVNGGRFAYEAPCEKNSLLMLVFPNFSEQPIFAEPGLIVRIKADASHMKEMKVTGSDENDLMTDFRLQIASASPPEVTKFAETFIEDHPESEVSVFILRRYFINIPNPDYAKVHRLIALMLPLQERNGGLVRLNNQVEQWLKTSDGLTVPRFSATDINGGSVSEKDVSDGVAVISTWASWRHESKEQQRKLGQLRRRSGGRLSLLSISLDPSKSDCRKSMQQDSISWPTVCDGNIWEGQLVQQMGFSNVPDNIVLHDGKVVARGLATSELSEKIDQLLK